MSILLLLLYCVGSFTTIQYIDPVSFPGHTVPCGHFFNLSDTRMMFIKHYAPNRCLCIKVAKLITGLRIAEMSQLQNCSVMCTKNGSYYENEKKREKVRGEGGCVQRMKVIVKRKKSQGGGSG